MNIRLSRNLAILLGLLAPLLETIRRWHTWQDDPLAFFDDYILGGLLLYGAWRVTKNALTGQKFLTAAWGFALGLGYASVDFQLQQVRAGAADPAPISTEWVAAVKIVGLALILIGLITSLRSVDNVRPVTG
jgi:hypothetical protein